MPARMLAPMGLLAALAPFFLQAAPAIAGSAFDEAERGAIREIVRELLREEPELVLEALQTLRARQQEAEAAQRRGALERNRALLERDPATPVGGNPEGDVTLVEFFDYRCPYCRAVMPIVQELAGQDGNIRLVFKEWPILGAESEFAARAALAAAKQGRYDEFHAALMQLEQVTPESVVETARTLGLDVDRLRADMQAPEVRKHLEETARLARELGITGTPAFVVGDHLVPGMADRATLEALVERARRKGS